MHILHVFAVNYCSIYLGKPHGWCSFVLGVDYGVQTNLIVEHIIHT